MAGLRGTPEERRQEKQKRALANQAEMHAVRARTAATGWQLLIHACGYAKAVGKDLNDQGRRDLARELAQIVERRTQR